MDFKSPGKIIFDPLPITGNAEKMFKPWWAIVTVDGDIDKYYRWFLQNHYGLVLQRPAWGPHISLIRGEEVNRELWEEFKAKYNNQPIEFHYEAGPRTNGGHWWLRVICDQLKDLRVDLGLPRDGKWGLHLTLGMPHPLHLEHSYCIHREIEKAANVI
jgi:hypothetical protein